MNNQNLKPFKPGQSGNPAGRPKGKSIAAVISLAREQEGVMESIAQTLITHAKRGNMSALKIILDRTEPTQKEALQ